MSPPDTNHDVLQPPRTTSEQTSRALTVEDFLHWSARTPPTKRYGGRKHRQAKQQSRLYPVPAPAVNASSENRVVGEAPRLSGSSLLGSPVTPADRVLQTRAAARSRRLHQDGSAGRSPAAL